MLAVACILLLKPQCAETRHTLLSRQVIAFEQRHTAGAALLHS
jgi:hypothetical protein